MNAIDKNHDGQLETSEIILFVGELIKIIASVLVLHNPIKDGNWTGFALAFVGALWQWCQNSDNPINAKIDNKTLLEKAPF